jgi:hypothetical protein
VAFVSERTIPTERQVNITRVKKIIMMRFTSGFSRGVTLGQHGRPTQALLTPICNTLNRQNAVSDFTYYNCEHAVYKLCLLMRKTGSFSTVLPQNNIKILLGILARLEQPGRFLFSRT